MYKVKLSILVMAYNHERYILEALDSIRRQNKDFSYEVLIGEDCSDDATRDVLQAYDSSELSNFNVFYHKHNMGMIRNMLDLSYKAEGEYIIILEGDDFWIDPDKLKKQIDFLDNHTEYIAVGHKCLVVDEFSRPLPYSYSAECHKKEYTIRDYREGILPGQTATIMYRNIYKNKNISEELEIIEDYPGDRRIAFLLVSNGKVKCLNERMSAYRHITLGGTSHSATHVEDLRSLQANLRFFRSLYEYSKRERTNELNFTVSAQCYYNILFRNQFRKKVICPRSSFLRELFREEKKGAIITWIIYSTLHYPIEVGKRQCEQYKIKRIHTKRKILNDLS